MKYRKLGNTGIEVSEIAFGAEFLVERPYEDTEELIRACEDNRINFVDCWMSEPNVRSNLGLALEGHREKWYIQGHIGSTWQDGQYVRTREVDKVKEAFESSAAKEFFDTERIVALLDDHKAGKADNSRKIWTIYVFLVWYKVYFEDEKVA